MARLLSVNVGLPQDVRWQGKTVHTGIWKRPVAGPRMVRRLNIDGDGQGDLAGHGGEQRAVFVYQIESYRHWQDYLRRDELDMGAFGENFTIDGLSDDEVCVGDRFRIGEAEFEVTQPRVTCYRVGMRLGEPRIPALLVAHRRPGFYLRVLTEGRVQAGDEIVRTRSEPHRLTIAAVDGLLYLPHRDVEALRHALQIPALSPGWQQSFRELLEAAEGDARGASPATAAEPGWPGFRRLRVVDVVHETDAVTSVSLASESGDPLPRPRAGQYLTLRVAGAGDPPPVRNYSLSSSPTAARYRISVKRETRGVVSGFVHDRLRPGTLVDVAAPRGDFVLGAGTEPLLLISAGIGVTPVLAMLHQLTLVDSNRDVWWIHVARTPAEHAFAAEAHALLQSMPNAHECIFYSAPDAGEEPAGSAYRGRPTRATLGEIGLPMDASAYLCGPNPFMEDLRAMLVDIGLAGEAIHSELFGALAAVNPGITGTSRPSPHPPVGTAGTGPLVTFARSGLTVPWGEDSSLLELADSCDVPTRWSCRSGVCHTCVTPLLSGRIGYAPDPLEAPAEGLVLICCAQPDGEVALDM